MLHRFCVVALAALLCGPGIKTSAAWAITLADPLVIIDEGQYCGLSQDVRLACSQPLVPGAFRTTTVSLAPVPEGFLSASVDGPASGYGWVRLDAQIAMFYSVMITGPAGDMVPVQIFRILTGTADGTGDAEAFGGAAIFIAGESWDGGRSELLRESYSFYHQPDGSYVSINGDTFGVTLFDMQTNVPYEVIMMAALYVQAGSGTASATAYVDPHFEIDRAFAATGLYGIVLSPGVGNGVVPAPPAIGLMLVGLFALAASRRRLHG